MNTPFLLQPGVWLGEGKISFIKSPNIIKFYTKWSITEATNGELSAQQMVEMEGIKEHVFNDFTIYDIRKEHFSISIENEHIGKMVGKGLIDANIIAWEFRGNSELEGYEIYERQANGDYSFKAEYTSSDEYRTIVQGLIWRKD